MGSVASSRLRAVRRFPYFSLLGFIIGAAGLLALALPAVRSKVTALEYWTADWRTALLADRVNGPYERVAIVLFDTETFGGDVPSPMPRDMHANVLRILDTLGPSAIGVDFWFTKTQGEQKDAIFLDTVRNLRTPIVLGAVDAHTGEFTPSQLAYEQQFLAAAGRPAGNIHLLYDPGEIVRRTASWWQGSAYPESFPLLVAKAAGAQLGDAEGTLPVRIAWLRGPDNDVEPFLTISAGKILGMNETTRPEIEKQIRGRVVLTAARPQNSDNHNTALTLPMGTHMLGTMIHAHVLAQYLDGRAFSDLAGWQRAGFLGAIALAGFALSWLFWRRRFDFLSLGVATVALVALDAACYHWLRIALPLFPALYVWFFATLGGHNLHALVAWWHRRRGLRREYRPAASAA